MTTLREKIEEKYGVRHIGFYDIPGRELVDVYYQENPDRRLGHSNFLGVFVHPLTREVYLCDAKTIATAKYPAIRFPDGHIICSRYRHDYVTHGEAMLDGGLDYTRYNPKYPPNGYITVTDDHEVFIPHEAELKEAA